MIKQIYIINRELFEIIIDKEKVFYKDRKMPEPTQMIPMDNRIKLKILNSRNKLDPKLIEQFKLTKEEQVEYNEALKHGGNIERILGDICKKDCLKTGATLEKEEIK